eukprot:COSAG06_NODE_9518_length_1881_cov_50.394501_1_plen_159_part_00
MGKATGCKLAPDYAATTHGCLLCDGPDGKDCVEHVFGECPTLAPLREWTHTALSRLAGWVPPQHHQRSCTRHHPHYASGEDSERAQAGRSGPAGRCPREADDDASTPGGSRGTAQPTRSCNSERLASGSRTGSRQAQHRCEDARSAPNQCRRISRAVG